MKRTERILLTMLAFTGLAMPAWAEHGLLATTVRDSWIDQDVIQLAADGLVPTPDKPVSQLTNFEVAQLTAQAARLYLAQADPGLPPALPEDNGLPPAPAELPAPAPMMDSTATAQTALPSQDLQELANEFAAELSAMGVDVDQLEQSLQDAKDRNRVFAKLQQEYLKRTGTAVGGMSKGYFFNYRGFGANAVYPPMDYNAAMFIEMDVKSVPVPSILFDARIRLWRSIGMYYADPIQPEYQLRWISLSSFNDFGNFTAGDFYRSYTPLTLWNYDVPVYTLTDPTSFNRVRKDTEELVYVDHGPDWHLRGFQAYEDKDYPNDPFSGFGLQAMAGVMQDAGQLSFSSDYAGAKGSVRFWNDNIEVGGVGLLLWNDDNSANVPYQDSNTNPAEFFPSTFAKQYQIGSLTSRLTIPFADKASLTGSMENAFSEYDDDLNDPQREFKDWALSAQGALDIEKVHLSLKYLNVGPYFYSPGAQTNRYTPVSGSQGYLSTNLNGIDDSLPGYLDNTPFQEVGRPYFSPYDRTLENILPYGDSTPDREGVVLGLDAELLEKGWLKPQASFTSMQEIQPNYVVNSTGTGEAPIDGDTTPRNFTGAEGALTVDLVKALKLKKKNTYDVSVDYKYQQTDLGQSLAPFKVDTFIVAGDFTVPLKPIASVVWSAAFEMGQSTGGEYTLVGAGSPPTLGQYQFYLTNPNSVQYLYQALNITRQTYAFGFLYPLSDKIDFHMDYFYTTYKWTDQPDFERNEQIWRFLYEAHF